MSNFEIDNIKLLAQKLDNAAIQAKPIAQLSEEVTYSLEDAYNIQDELIDLRLKRDEHITGYKLGFTSKAKMKQMNVDDLIWGVLTDKMQIKFGEKIDLNKYIHPRAEPEVAFKVAKTINHKLTLEEIPEYIDKMTVAIEVIDSRYKNFKFSLADVIADNCSSIGYCLGEWQNLKTDITKNTIDLKFNGETVQSGYTKAILENPFQSVVELSRLIVEKDIELKPDQVILAGAVTAAEWIKSDSEISAYLEDFGQVSFSVK